MTNQKFSIRPGMYLVASTGRATGGVSIVRHEVKERNVGAGREKTYHGTRFVDHANLCAEADKLASKGRALVRKHAVSTDIGWIAHLDGVKALLTEFETLRLDVRSFNHRARLGGSARRVTVGAVPVEINVDNEAAAVEIARSIQETLSELLEKISEGDVQKARTFITTRAKNLPALAMGMQKFALQDALACAKACLTELGVAKKENRQPNLDTDAIESAQGLFGSWDDDEEASDARAAG